MLGEQKLSSYGTRDAAMNWAKQHTGHVNNNVNDNDTLRQGQPTSVRGLALRA